MLGTIVNAAAILIGSGLGLILPAIPDRVKDTIMQGLSLAVIIIGLGMALADQNDILLIIISMVVGALVGEWIGIEKQLSRLGQAVERKAKKLADGRVAEAFVAASLIYCVGSMAIVGSVQSGVHGDNRTLFAKSLLDGFSSIIFTSTLGIGVALSAGAVFLYEGLIASAAFLAGSAMNNPHIILCASATGGLLIVAIGVNLLGVAKIAVGNLLPAMFIAGFLAWAWPPIQLWIHTL